MGLWMEEFWVSGRRSPGFICGRCFWLIPWNPHLLLLFCSIFRATFCFKSTVTAIFQGNLLLIHCHLAAGCLLLILPTPVQHHFLVLFELVPSDSNLSAQWRRKWVLVVGRLLLLQFLVLELQQLAASSHGHVGVTKCH